MAIESASADARFLWVSQIFSASDFVSCLNTYSQTAEIACETMISLAQIAAQIAARRRGGAKEFLTDPLLTVAAFMLVAVCVLWILFSRLISFNLRRKARKLRMYEDRIQSGMSAEEIREVDARRRHRRRKIEAEPDAEAEAEPDAEPDAEVGEEPTHSM